MRSGLAQQYVPQASEVCRRIADGFVAHRIVRLAAAADLVS
jgi:hypothetical protein